MVCRTFFSRVQNRVFFCFQVSFCPVKRGNRAGPSRNESVYSQRGTQTSFPLLDCRSCDKFGVRSSFCNFLARKKKLIKQSPLFDQLVSFLITQLKNEILAPATLEKSGKLVWVPLREYVVRLIPRRPGSISSLYGAKTNLKAKTSLFATSKKCPAYKTALLTGYESQ